MFIQLSDDEERSALDAAKRRQAGAAGNRNRYGAVKNRSKDEDLLIHLQGCRGELAAGKAYQVPVPLHVNTYHSVADIGAAGEVRTRSNPGWDLIVRPADPVDRYYVLVIGSRTGPLDVIGGIWGLDARKKEYVADHGGYGSSWFVPQEALEPPEKIPPGWL